MRTATKRTILSLLAVAGLVFGLVPAGAQTPTDIFKGSVDVRNVLAGAGAKEFKLTVTRTAGNILAPPVNAVIVHVPSAFTLRSGQASGWTASILDPRRVFFTGGTIPSNCGATTPNTTCSATFSIFADVPTPAQDVTSRWKMNASNDGGVTTAEVPPDGTGALDTVTRVLQVTSLSITAPSGATDNSVTGTQNNVDAVCQIQNVGSGNLNVTADLTGASATTANPQQIPSGGSATYGFRFAPFTNVNDTATETKSCSGSAPFAATTGFGKSVSVTIQPRATFDYVAESLSPTATAPLATPNFLIQVNKRQENGPPMTGTPPAPKPDTSPAVTLDPAKTDFTILSDKGNIGPTPLGSVTTVNAGKQNAVNLQFTALRIPAGCNPPTVTTNCVEDKNYNVQVNVGGVDANGYELSYLPRPLPNTSDQLRIDAAIPVINLHSITAPMGRCCGARDVVKNGDTLSLSAKITDRDPTGASLPCGDCQVVVSELIQLATEEGNGGEVGSRIPVPLVMDPDTGELTGTYTSGYAPAAKSIQHHLIVKDTAGNRSDGGSGSGALSRLIAVDNIAPFIKLAATSPAPSDLQRTLTLQFSEDVDNFDQGAGGICPQTDWRLDNNSVVSCVRSDGFRGAGLTVANMLPDDTPGVNLQYFPQTPLSFHDRVGNAIEPGTTVPIVDRIPPKAPSFSTVAGKAADSGDGKYYTFDSTPPVVLTGARAIVAGYTAQLWRETNGQAGLQVTGSPGNDPNDPADDVSADEKIGQEIVQSGQTTVTVTPTVDLPGGEAQTGTQYQVYARSLDTASPANGTDLATVKSALIVVDTKAPELKKADASVNGIEVDFLEPVTGLNAAVHWLVLDNNGDSQGVGSVQGSGQTRTIKMADSAYCANPGCAVRPVSVSYLFFGAATDRFQDKAGNVVADKKVDVFIAGTAP